MKGLIKIGALKNKNNIKKIVKLLGNIAAVIAVIFVVKRFVDMGIDFSLLKQPNIIAALIILIFTILITLLCNGYPWMNLVSFFSGKQLKMSEIIPIYTLSNIYKYVPGNIFQYVGRNRLAVEKEISHIDVAVSTTADVVLSLFWGTLLAVFLIGHSFKNILLEYKENITFAALICIVILIIVALIMFKYKKRLIKYTERYKKAFKKGNMHYLAKSVLYYIAVAIFSMLSNLFAMYLILGNDMNINDLIKYTGVYSISYIIGFITPGAPAGVGIREAVMLLFCGEVYQAQIGLYILVQRLAGILSDLLGGIIGALIKLYNSKKEIYKNGGV